MLERTSRRESAAASRKDRLASAFSGHKHVRRFCDEEETLHDVFDSEAEAVSLFHGHTASAASPGSVIGYGGWEGALKAAMELAAGKQRDAVRLQRVEAKLEEIAKRINDCGSIIVPVSSLAPSPYELIKPIPVVVQPGDGEFLATFFDANVNASGDTETEAVQNLKEIMLAVFAYQSKLPEDKLGPGPRQQFAVLKEFIKKRS